MATPRSSACAWVTTSCFFVIFLSVTNGAPRPNIILIVADDLGWNDVGFHGSDQIPTPNIDALAYNGIILNRHYTLPTCTPSRAALMTGKYPIRTGMHGRPLKCGEPRGLPLSEITLPQRLKTLDYVNRLVGKWHLGYHKSEYTPTKRGFDSHFGYWNGYIGYFDYIVDQENFVGYDLHRNMNTSWTEKGRYATDVFTQEAVNLILSHNTSRPLFLKLSHLAVHSGRDTMLLEVPNLEEALRKFDYIPDTQRRIFAEMTTKLDDSVGQIVTALLDRGILNNTVIVFLSDNGAQTIGLHRNWGSNWPLRGLKFTAFEGGVRGVAAVWSASLRNPGRVTTQLMHITDWYPTIYSMAGGDVSELGDIDGVDQWPSILGVDNMPRTSMLLNFADVDDVEAVVQGKWKLVRSTYKEGAYDGFHGEDGRGTPNPPYDRNRVMNSAVAKAIQTLNMNIATENTIQQLRKQATISCNVKRLHAGGSFCPSDCLFDLESDPCESVNLVSNHPDVAVELRKELDKFRREVAPELTKPVDPASNPALFNNTWVCWLDNVTTATNTPTPSSTTVLTASVLVLLASSVFVFHFIIRDLVVLGRARAPTRYFFLQPGSALLLFCFTF
ncbi:arylsulfatase B-like [Periplaneta americana]|uniref:arylsulfatase B-like n=1 Tax=Periplaneta americana TaxID=6978 RepID=UPI0037E98852